MKLSEVLAEQTGKHVALTFQSALLEEWPELDVNLSSEFAGIRLKTQWDELNKFHGLCPTLDILVFEVDNVGFNAAAKFRLPNMTYADDYRMDSHGISTFLPSRLQGGSQTCVCEGWNDVAGRFVHELKEVLKFRRYLSSD